VLPSTRESHARDSAWQGSCWATKQPSTSGLTPIHGYNGRSACYGSAQAVASMSRFSISGCGSRGICASSYIPENMTLGILPWAVVMLVMGAVRLCLSHRQRRVVRAPTYHTDISAVALLNPTRQTRLSELITAAVRLHGCTTSGLLVLIALDRSFGQMRSRA